MKLYVVSENKDVITRWKQMLPGHDIQVLSCHELSEGNLKLEALCGFVHLSSVSEECVDNISSLYRQVNWIGFADYPLDEEGLAILQKGFKGYINTYVTTSLCKEVLTVVKRNDIWAGPSITQKLLKQFLNQDLSSIPSVVESEPKDQDFSGYSLTSREEDVLKVLLTGASNKEIARELEITERTVKAHVTSILHKTDTKDRLTLIIKLNKQAA